MNTTKALISVCTCVVALTTASVAIASIPDFGAAAIEARVADSQRQRIQNWIATQRLPCVSVLARQVTQEIIARDGSVPGKAMLRPKAVPVLTPARVERPKRRSRLSPVRLEV